MKKRIIILSIMLVSLLCITGCGNNTKEEKKEQTLKVLYKMKIDELPYLKEKLISYYGGSDSNKVGFIINENDYCSLTQNIKNNNYSKTVMSKECSYTINENKLNLKLELGITIVNGSNVENKTENIEITGTFNETFEELNLELSDASYILVNRTYQKLLDRELQYALYDEETKEVYDLEGLSINEIDFSDINNLDGKKVQLDLSKYKIQETSSYDKTNNNQQNIDNQNQTSESNTKHTKEEAKKYADNMLEELKRQYANQGLDFNEALRSYGYSSESEYYNAVYEAYLNE